MLFKDICVCICTVLSRCEEIEKMQIWLLFKALHSTLEDVDYQVCIN